jgi:hypothetical protein
LLDEKEGGANVDGEQPIEVLNGGIFDGGGFRDPRIGDKDIQAVADGRHCAGSAASFAYLADDTVGFIGATAVMQQDLRTGGGECQRAGAADAAGGAGDESLFS